MKGKAILCSALFERLVIEGRSMWGDAVAGWGMRRLPYSYDQSIGPGGVHLMANAATKYVDSCRPNDLL